jgi:hypothetical protein
MRGAATSIQDHKRLMAFSKTTSSVEAENALAFGQAPLRVGSFRGNPTHLPSLLAHRDRGLPRRDERISMQHPIQAADDRDDPAAWIPKSFADRAEI